MHKPPAETRRFVGLDVHKSYVVVSAVDEQQNVVLPARRVELAGFESWVTRNLGADDAVVLEATTSAWHLCDQLKPRVGAVAVANPILIRLIASARVKTDAQDALKLARLLAAKLIPEVWIPPEDVRELRALVSHRRRLVAQRTQIRNRLHGVLQRWSVFPPDGNCFSAANKVWWEALTLPVVEKMLIRQDLVLLDSLQPLIEEAEVEIKRQSTVEPWANQVPFLVQLSGVGVLSAMVMLSAIGEIGRFESAKKLVGYAGLGASVHDSGQTHRGGRITKQGRKEMRSTLTECAWRAVESSATWRARFDRLASRIGRNKAIIAIARKILVLMWHVLRARAADRHGEPEKIALKLLTWFHKLDDQARQEASSKTFVLRQLGTLGLSVEGFWRGGRFVRLEPPAEAANS